MGEGFRRFLLRHRLWIGGALVGAALLVLVLVTMFRGEEGGEAGRTGEGSTLPPVRTPAEEPSARPEVPSQEEPPPEEASREVPPAPVPPPRSRSLGGNELAGLLGPRGRFAQHEEWTAVLGGGRLEVGDGRLHWSVRVIEDGITHVALGIPLEPLGGTGTFWVAGEVPGGHESTGPLTVQGIAEIPGPLAEALRRAGGTVEVELAGYRREPDGRRTQMASARARVPVR